MKIHGKFGFEKYNILGRLWYGTPRWAKAAAISTAGRLSNLCKMDECNND